MPEHKVQIRGLQSNWKDKLRNQKINIISKKGKAHECLKTDFTISKSKRLSSITKDLKNIKVKWTNRP